MPLTGVSFAAANHGWVVGLSNFAVWQATDGGVHWAAPLTERVHSRPCLSRSTAVPRSAPTAGRGDPKVCET